METNEKLLSLVADIYDASLDATRWIEVLGRMVDFVGAQSAGLVTLSISGETQVTHSTGVEPRFVKSYIEQYASTDPLAGMRFSQIGKINTTDDWTPAEEFRRSRFYREWAQPQGLEDAANMLLDKSADTLSYVSVMKAGTPVDDRLRNALSSLLPHLQRAVLIGGTMQQRSSFQATVAKALDAFKAAVFLLDAKANITHVNTAGQEILLRKDFLRSMQGRLIAANDQTNRILREALTASIHGDGASSSNSITLALVAHDGTRYVGHVLPLTAGRRRQIANAYEASAMLFVNKASLEAAFAPDIVQKVFRLTPAELRVLLSIVEIGGVPEVARSLDVAESTVKTHLNNIFAKTDTKRQADLVKLIAAFSPPIRS